MYMSHSDDVKYESATTIISIVSSIIKHSYGGQNFSILLPVLQPSLKNNILIIFFGKQWNTERHLSSGLYL